MVIDRELINRYLLILEDAILRIKGMKFDLDTILDDVDTQDLLDRRMQKAIEACIDIAACLVAELKLPKTFSAGELFKRLAQEGIIETKLADNLTKAVGLRNIIVHEYSKIDYHLAYKDLPLKLKDLQDFGYQIKRFLDQKAPTPYPKSTQPKP